MQKLSKNFLVVVLILLTISALFALFSDPFNTVERVSLSQLANSIREGSVKEIVVSGTKLTITYADDTTKESTKEAQGPLPETLLHLGVAQEALNAVNIEAREETGFAAIASSLGFLLLPLLIFFVFFWFMFRQARSGIGQAFDFTKARARLFGAEGQTKPKVSFKDVAGLQEAKEEVQEVVDFLKNPKKYLEMGAKIPRGVLLVGPPGTGKTLLAKAVAAEAGVSFFSASGSEFIEMFVGVGSSRVRDLFATAKKAGRSIIFIDELDAIGRTRGFGFGGGHDEREQTLNQILVEMDGFERNDTQIVMAASVTGDTPVLTKQEGEYRLQPIAEIIDSYYQEGEENIEKVAHGLQVLGFQGEKHKDRKNIFRNSAFQHVRSVFRHKVHEIFEIDYLGGKIKTTGNHSVFVRERGGVMPKLTSQLRAGDVLVDLPYKTQQQDIRAQQKVEEFELELPLWTPLFEQFMPVQEAYEYALAHAEETSQTKLGRQLGFSQRTIGKWQQGICNPRALSRDYYKHRRMLPETIKVTSELMRLFGYYVAEGYARKEIDFCFHVDEKEYIEDVKHLIRSVFGLEPHAEKRQTPNAVNLVYQCKPVANFFLHHCGKGAKNKHIPEFLFEAPHEYFIEFLRGYAAGDGHVDKRGKLELTSVSKRLIYELNWLARMHGFKGYIGSFTAKEERIIGNGKPLPETKAYRLGFGKTQNPLTPQTQTPNAKRAIVKSIKRLPYDGYVYDFCGCENEAFFGGSSPILLHNTNRPDVLDSALLRPGRFDRRVILDLPDVDDRDAILKIHADGKPLADGVNLREIAERTPGFSGADLANLMNEAAILTARRNKQKISQAELYESIDKVLLGPERKSHVLTKKEKDVTAYHEAGHALVASSLEHVDPVRKISIISRGRAGGYTLKLPSEDKHMKSRAEFMDELAVLLGGYAAEETVFGDVTTGPSNDLEKASEIARGIVKEYGMSEKLGPVTYGEKDGMPFLGKAAETQKNYSETTALEIDKEVAKFIEEARKVADRIVRRKRKTLDKIAKVLVEKETIEREEFEQLVGKDAPRKKGQWRSG